MKLFPLLLAFTATASASAVYDCGVKLIIKGGPREGNYLSNRVRVIPSSIHNPLPAKDLSIKGTEIRGGTNVYSDPGKVVFAFDFENGGDGGKRAYAANYTAGFVQRSENLMMINVANERRGYVVDCSLVQTEDRAR